MDCDTCQDRIIELVDTSRGVSGAPDVEQHLAGCEPCRRFREACADLDARLSERAAKSVLPVAFAHSLLSRLPTPPVRLTPGEVRERRARYEREHLLALAALRRRFLVPNPSMISRFIVVGGVFGAAATLLMFLVRVLPPLTGPAIGSGGGRGSILLLLCLTGLAAAVARFRGVALARSHILRISNTLGNPLP